MSYEYDLEIVMPISMVGKYKNRFENFKKYGLQEVGQNKILISLLTGTEKVLNATEGWPENVTVRVVPTTVNQCAAKVNKYYSDYKLEDLDKSKWFMRLDDDSITRVDQMMKFLNSVDTHRDYYFVNFEMYVGDILVEQDIFKHFGMWDELHGEYFHEIEASIISNGALRRILTSDVCQKVLAVRSGMEIGFTDICLAFLCKYMKIFPIPLYGISHRSEPDVIKDYLHRRRFHIHKIAEDINPIAYSFVSKIKNLKFIDKPLLYWCIDNGDDVPLYTTSIKLISTGEIFTKNQTHELFWDYSEETKELRFLDFNYNATTVFKNVENNELPRLEGESKVYSKKQGTVKHGKAFIQSI